MKIDARPVESLQITDLENHAVWQFTHSPEDGDTVVRPVKVVPVTNLNSRVVATRIKLANGNLCWALIGNIDVGNARLTEHFLTLSVEKDGKWFTLSRYHDVDYTEHGPDALGRFLGVSTDDIFPISYDISQYVKGSLSGLSGQILKEPRERLTRAEIIAMAVP